MSSINKGFNMAVEEFETAIINVINQSGLPMAVSKMVIERVSVKVNNQLAIDIETERRNYEESLIKEREKIEKVEVVPLHVNENGEVHPLKVVKVGEA